jgi:hypothetical protein
MIELVARSVTTSASPDGAIAICDGVVCAAASGRTEPEIGASSPCESTRKPAIEFGTPALRT